MVVAQGRPQRLKGGLGGADARLGSRVVLIPAGPGTRGDLAQRRLCCCAKRGLSPQAGGNGNQRHGRFVKADSGNAVLVGIDAVQHLVVRVGSLLLRLSDGDAKVQQGLLVPLKHAFKGRVDFGRLGGGGCGSQIAVDVVPKIALAVAPTGSKQGDHEVQQAFSGINFCGHMAHSTSR